MKIIVIGCVKSTLLSIESILELDNTTISGVITKKKSSINSDFVDLSSICKKSNIDIFYTQNNGSDYNSFIQKKSPDYIYCIGWSHLLNKKTLSIPKQGTIGFHPASLPNNRGRHPIIWALALGLKETASSFFLMDEGADSGAIVNQKKINIEHSDNATSLYEKILTELKQQVKDITTDASLGQLKSIDQDHSLSNYWRKRSRKDGIIDWRMPACDIHNLIRALTPPYPGAEIYFQEQYFIVQNSKLSEKSFSKNIEPGYIIRKYDDHLLIKCAGESALEIKQKDLSNYVTQGSYLI